MNAFNNTFKRFQKHNDHERFQQHFQTLSNTPTFINNTFKHNDDERFQT